MKERNPILVFVFGLITLGIYSWYWAVKTKGEMNKLGEKIPTAWIWLIPIVGSIWWYWKYSEGVEHVTNEKTNGILAFILLYILGFIGQAIIQDVFNGLSKAPAAAVMTPTAPLPPISPAQVDQSSPEPAATAVEQPVESPVETPVEQTSTPVPETPAPETNPTTDSQLNSDNDPTETSPPTTPPIGSV